MITFYAHESATKYYNIPEDNLINGTVYDLLRYFRSKGHVSSAQFDAKQLELKLVVKDSDLVSKNHDHSLIVFTPLPVSSQRFSLCSAIFGCTEISQS